MSLRVKVVAAWAAGLVFTAHVHAAPDWVNRSDENSRLLLEIIAQFNPENAAQLGVEGVDEGVIDLGPRLYERQQKAVGNVSRELEKRLQKESDTPVRQDLAILIQAAHDNMESARLAREYLLPYYNLTQTIFQGIRALLDPQVDAARYPAAVVRVRKYAGLESGFRPITDLARDRTREHFREKNLVGPFRGEVEQDLERAETFIDGIEKLFAGAGVAGWQEPWAVLAAQLREYNDWLRKEILPRARDDFRLPPPVYRDNLHNWGVDADPDALIAAAAQGYMDIRNEMVALAPLIAREKGFDTSDYREVIRLLKQEQVPGDELESFYQARLAQLEQIIRDEQLVTLPARKAGIRVATAAETAASPAAHLDVPRLIGNTGEYPTFVIPLIEKNDDGTWKGTDDTVPAGSWTLTAHEARPGHELQFSAMLERGVSQARAIFAFNSANVEGWGLYAEAIAKPYMPLDGQLFSLQYRLARAARMFLDPMLNLGRISPENAKRLLLEDVVLGETWAQNEIERYTYRIPGQATAYYYGYSNLQALRTETELLLQDAFNLKDFHDFILGQGLLPPQILRDAVMNEFVKRYRKS